MSKFFITNNANWFGRIKDVVEKSPFEVSGQFASEGIYGLATKKLQIDNQNIFIEGENVIIQTGTCVYKEEHGLPALKNALKDFNGNVENHREDYIGNFGCFIKKGKNMVVFNEASGFYDIFYYTSSEGWMVGTTVVDLAGVLKDRLSVNKLNVLEELTRFAIFDNGTYFNEISRLSGDQLISLSSSSLAIGSLDLCINQKDINEYHSRAKNISKEMKYIAEVMYKNFGQTTLGCTGGFDSRMTLAAYLSAGLKPRISYGYGNSNVAESKMGDVEVDQEYSRRYGLEFRLEKWNETKPLDKQWDEYIEKFGRMIYDGNEDAYNYYTRTDEPFLSFGYIAEIYREADWSKNIPNDKMTLEDYLWENHAECNTNIIKRSPQLIEQLLKKWGKLNKEHDIEDDCFKKEELFWLLLAYRHSADNQMVNLINQFKYAHYLMSDIRILRNGYVDFNIKYNGKFMIQMLNEAYPDILNVPFFTHCHKMAYNSKSMMVEELSSAEISKRIKPFVRAILPSSVKSFINRTFKRSVEGRPYLDEVETILHKEENAHKLQRLVGLDIYNAIDLRLNHIFVLRGIILCKTFDRIGVEY